MDNFDISDLAGVSQQSLLFDTYPQPQPSNIKRQQNNTQTDFSLPLYNSIEDWSAAELTTDSAPSPGSGSPISPIFPGFSSFTIGDEWTSWSKLERSPDSDFFLKSELLDSPDLSSIPVMSPELSRLDASNPGLDDVVQFGSEGVNDTRPLFQSPQMNLAMPSRQQAPAPGQAQSSTGLPTPPEATQPSQQRRYPARANLKRKSSSDDDDDDASSPSSPRSSCSPPPPRRRHTAPSIKEEASPSAAAASSAAATSKAAALGPKKTAHNMIEKRYRTNLNDKIAALRDSVPALRVMVHRLEHADDVEAHLNPGSMMDEIKAEAGVPLDMEDDLGGVAPAHKLNKATILSKATEYIAHLERRNRALAKENSALRNRVEGFEMLVMSSRGGQSQRPMWQ